MKATAIACVVAVTAALTAGCEQARPRQQHQPAALTPAPVAATPLILVDNGKSDYVIYLDATAPASVHAAAADLQEFIEKVSGVRLPLVREPHQPMLALGNTPAAARAGLSSDGMPLEGFRMAVRGPNLFILGPDTADGARTPQGGTSNGTANGAYAFIEQALGVRWLMPGEHGDYVPARATITVPGADVSDAPFFLNRRVPYIQESRPEVKRWWARQRLGLSLALYHSHNWQWTTMDDFRAHPDWFAEQGGTRMPPAGDFSKLCATSDGLVRAFADRAIKYFDERPQATCFSLSPSDGGGWCECANCKTLYETDPDGHLSVTPAIVAFYNRIAELVAQKHPQKLLAGYVYANYVYPPSKPFQLAPNMFLVWAPSFDYGFTLFRPDMQQRWDALVPQWTKVTTNISYYDLPNCVHNEMGAMNPPGLKILKWLYPRLKQAQMKGVYVYGNPAWGYAGPMNYLLARLAWNPDADVDALFDEYIRLCYAEGAPEMKRFYVLLDDATEAYYNANHKETYVLSEDRLRKVYGANFAELERLYRAAETKIADPNAKARLDMLGVNMTILHWNLRQFKAAASLETSSFYLPDKEFFAALKPWNGSLAISPPSRSAQAVAAERLVALRPLQAPNAEAMTPFLLRGNQRLVLKPTGAGTVEVGFSDITSRGKLLKWHLFDDAGASIDQGVASPDAPITVTPTAGTDYYQVVIAAGSASFAVTVSNAAWALATPAHDRGLHFLGKTTPVYFEVPDGVTRFEFWLASDAPGETATARLYAPDGQQVASFRTVEKAIDTQDIAVAHGHAGVWMIVVDKAELGVLDDVYLKPGPQLSGYLSLDPRAVLGVTKAQ